MNKLSPKTRRTMWMNLETRYQGFLDYRWEIGQGCIVSPKPFGNIF